MSEPRQHESESELVDHLIPDSAQSEHRQCFVEDDSKPQAFWCHLKLVQKLWESQINRNILFLVIWGVGSFDKKVAPG